MLAVARNPKHGGTQNIEAFQMDMAIPKTISLPALPRGSTGHAKRCIYISRTQNRRRTGR